MLDPKAVEAAAKAIRSDIWEIEPNPTTERYVAGLRQEAMDQAEAAITAYLSTITPAEVGGLVAELRDEDFRHEMQHLRSSSEIDRLFQAAASLIQSQAARIAELEAGLEFYGDVSKYPAPLTGGMGALWSDCGQVARSLLNGERKG